MTSICNAPSLPLSTKATNPPQAEDGSNLLPLSAIPDRGSKAKRQAAVTTETTLIETAGGTPLIISGYDYRSSKWTATVDVESTTMTETLETITLPPLTEPTETFAALTITMF